MKISRRIALSFATFSALCLLALPVARAADRREAEESINAGLFEAMDAGQVDVKIIPKDATQANVLIRNLTDKPMTLRLPKTFASVPILAQGMGGGMGGMGGF